MSQSEQFTSSGTFIVKPGVSTYNFIVVGAGGYNSGNISGGSGAVVKTTYNNVTANLAVTIGVIGSDPTDPNGYSAVYLANTVHIIAGGGGSAGETLPGGASGGAGGSAGNPDGSGAPGGSGGGFTPGGGGGGGIGVNGGSGGIGSSGGGNGEAGGMFVSPTDYGIGGNGTADGFPLTTGSGGGSGYGGGGGGGGNREPGGGGGGGGASSAVLFGGISPLYSPGPYGSYGGAEQNGYVLITWDPPPTPTPLPPTPQSKQISMRQIVGSLYSDNALVYYKTNSLPSCGVGTVRNSRHTARKT